MSSQIQHIENNQKYFSVLMLIVLLEFLVFYLSGISVTAFVGNDFVGFEQDPLLWLIYYLKIPTVVISNSLISVAVDVSIFVCLIWLFFKPYNNKLAIILFLLMLIFYAVFIGHLGHRNYQCGYLIVLIPLLFQKQLHKQILFECIRYFLLFFYCTAAYFKIKSGSLFEITHLSEIVSGQFTPYFLENNLSWRTDLNLFLINHHKWATLLYWGAFLAEVFTLIAFFTKKYDFYIGIGLLVFHLFNWVIMDISPFGQIAFISILFFSKKLGWSQTKDQKLSIS
jgi:hypothetical protein